MPRRRRIATLATLTIVACSVAEPPATGERFAEAAAPVGWKQIMKRLGEHFDVVQAQLAMQPAGDLRAVAEAATAGAELVRRGYGESARPEVANFARMARDAESWLLRIAAEAGQSHGAIAQDLFRGGEARYCARCHDACEAAR